jgi:hypothetical protein
VLESRCRLTTTEIKEREASAQLLENVLARGERLRRASMAMKSPASTAVIFPSMNPVLPISW